MDKSIFGLMEARGILGYTRESASTNQKPQHRTKITEHFPDGTNRVGDPYIFRRF